MMSKSSKLAAQQGRTKLTPPQLAQRYGCKPSKIIAWIRSGELRAIDSSTRPGVGRPRYLIDLADVAIFEERRTVKPAKTVTKRRPKQSNVTEYF